MLAGGSIQGKSPACCWEGTSSVLASGRGDFPEYVSEGGRGSKPPPALCNALIQTIIYVSESHSWICIAFFFFPSSGLTRCLLCFGMMQEALASCIRFTADVFLSKSFQRQGGSLLQALWVWLNLPNGHGAVGWQQGLFLTALIFVVRSSKLVLAGFGLDKNLWFVWLYLMCAQGQGVFL